MPQYHCTFCDSRFESNRDWATTCENCGREDLEPQLLKAGVFKLVDPADARAPIIVQAGPISNMSVLGAKAPLLLFMLVGIGTGFALGEGSGGIRDYATMLAGAHALLVSLFGLGFWHTKTKRTFMGLSSSAWTLACVVAYGAGLLVALAI